MIISQLLGISAVDCSKTTFLFILFAQALPEYFPFLSSALKRIYSVFCGVTWMSRSLFSCSSLARPAFPLPPSIALNNFGVSCFCPNRPAKPRGCCTGGPGAGFPFSFSSTLETGKNENTRQCSETYKSSCKTKMPHSWMKTWHLFQPFFFLIPDAVARAKLIRVRVLLALASLSKLQSAILIWSFFSICCSLN